MQLFNVLVIGSKMNDADSSEVLAVPIMSKNQQDQTCCQCACSPEQDKKRDHSKQCCKISSEQIVALQHIFRVYVT